MKNSKLKKLWDKLTYSETFLGLSGCFCILVFIAILVLIFSDKADEIIEYIFAAGFFFIMGTVFGLHRAKIQDIKSKRKEKHISD